MTIRKVGFSPRFYGTNLDLLRAKLRWNGISSAIKQGYSVIIDGKPVLRILPGYMKWGNDWVNKNFVLNRLNSARVQINP